MFILVREDLDPSYRMVQGMHAVHKLAETLPISCDPTKTTFVCLKVKTMRALYNWINKMSDATNLERMVVWSEPDLDNQMTATACYCEDGSMFKSLQLA
jgi:hypothetical protein